MSRKILIAALLLPCAAALAQSHAPHWSYRGATGPERWGTLEQGFSTCGAGREQSPVDIRTSASQRAALPAISFHYRPSPLKIVDNGHTIQVNYAAGSFIEVAGQRYELLQFHFHKPSEEAIDGRRHDMVAHLVHRDAQGRLAVVAVLLDAGSVNPLMALLWNNLPTRKESEVEAAAVQIDASELLPANRAYYTFAGSLTTPPCSEGVTWFVLKTPVTVSGGQLERFGRAYPMNARPVQPLNARVIRASD